MLVRVFGASAFGLRGGIPMEAAQTMAHTNVYHAPASRGGITWSIRLPTTHSLAKKRGAPMPPSKVWECTRRTEVMKQGPGPGRLCESKKRQRPSRYASHTQGPS